MNAWLVLGLLSGALASPPPDVPVAEPWKARLTVGARAASLDSPTPLGVSFVSDALLELRMFHHVSLQVGTWPFVVPALSAPPGSCQSPAPASLHVGVSEFGDGWELGAMAGVTLNVNNSTQCLARRYVVITPFLRIGRDHDFGVDAGAGFFYITLKELWLGVHAPVGRLRAFLDGRVSLFGWAAAELGVEVPGALVGLPRALAIRLEAGLAAVGWTVSPSWRLGPQGGLGMSWTW
ncbi:MAG TPA: hypothetical protein VND93_13025 [Myxococcales bacterium]|jgi:hypothetical protein|nr:hypothetical protein [Myxococcales bacterium]